MKKFLLRVDDDIYASITKYAKDKNISLNTYITSLLEAEVSRKKSDFKHRNIIGALIKGSNILEDKGLIEVAGIYYKYLIDQDQKISSKSFYKVIEASGNVITIKKEDKV